MTQFIQNRFQTEEQTVLETPQQTMARFVLMYKGLHIGTLELKQGLWTFQYSEPFRQQTTVKKIRPLLNFPKTEHLYQSDELWPFFTTRIPGLSQPQIQAILKREAIDATNTVSLLQRFGRVTISNPFLLMQSAIAA
jgi:HipA-like protein